MSKKQRVQTWDDSDFKFHLGERLREWGSDHIGTVIIAYENAAVVEWDDYYPKRGRISGRDSQDRTQYVMDDYVRKATWDDEMRAFYHLRWAGIECPEPPKK